MEDCDCSVPYETHSGLDADARLTVPPDDSTRLALPASDLDSKICTPPLKNAKAYLMELPVELFVEIIKYFDIEDDRKTLLCLSRTSRGLKCIADEQLYGQLNNELGHNMAGALITLRANDRLATLVEDIHWFGYGPIYVDHGLGPLLQITPNIRKLYVESNSPQETLELWKTILETATQTVTNGGPTKFAHLESFFTNIPMELPELQQMFRLPSLKTLSFKMFSVTSTEAWSCLEPKSRLHELELEGIFDGEVLARIVSSIESLKSFSYTWLLGIPAFFSAPAISWSSLKGSLATHKDSLEELRINCWSIGKETLGSMYDSRNLKILHASFRDIVESPPHLHSLTEVLPRGLTELKLEMLSEDKKYAQQYSQAIIALKGHRFLQTVRITLLMEISPPFEQLRFSTIMETLEQAGIKFTVEATLDAFYNPTDIYLSIQELQILEENPDAQEELYGEGAESFTDDDDFESGSDTDG